MIYNSDNKNNVKLAAEKILNGEIIIYPTDTLYGLGGDATNCKAIDSLNKLKKRAQKYSIIISSINDFNKYAYLSDKIKQKIKKIFPGPYTVILNKKKSDLSSLVDLNSKTVGIRIPDNDFILEVAKKCDKPIVSTSVNYHGQKSIQDIKEIESFFNNIDIFEKGENTNSLGSTIIDMTKDEVKIIRYGDGDFIV